MHPASPGPPEDVIASSHDTVDELVGSVRDGTPIRIGFAQVRTGEKRTPGPLSQFVTSGDHRGLVLYLLLMTRATRREPWNAVLPAAVWARAVGVELPTTKTASSTISKTWRRLAERNLVIRTRSGQYAELTMLREDGSGRAYSHPGNEGGYFKLPHAFWKEGPEGGDERWYEVLDLPAVAMLLISMSLQPGFAFPVERTPERYGFSADTALRGVTALHDFGILEVRKNYRKEPLSPLGYTYESRYALQAPYTHRRGRRSSEGST